MDPLQRVTPEEAGEWPNRHRAHFFNCLSGFKALQLLGTTDGKGHHNLGIFSQVFHIGANPPHLGILFRPHTVERHSLENLLETGVFTLNHVQESFFKAAHQTAAKYPRDTSEFKAVELTPHFSDTWQAPYVKESSIRIGLEVAEHHVLQVNQTQLVVGRIREVWYPENCVQQDGFLDLDKAGSLTGSGMDGYYRTELLARMAYAQPDQAPRPLSTEL